MKKHFILLFVIIVVASFLRLYQLGNVPPSPDWDEVALGYNAYSILKTGRDEYGSFLPLSIRSFNDYKPPLYTYLTVPSVAIFGLSTFSTRLPSAIMGIIAVVGVYFLVTELMTHMKTKINQQVINYLPFLSSLLLAISPWHLQFSRVAFEACTGVTINIWAVALFLAGLRKKIFLPIAAVLFSIGIYSYHSERIFLPLLLCLLLIIFWRKLIKKEMLMTIFLSLIVGLLIIIPLLPELFNKSAISRLSGSSIFADQTKLLSNNIVKFEADWRAGDKIGMFLDNRRFVWVKTVVSGYLSHFSLKWLFLTGDNPRHHAPDMGLLYLWELPFMLYGLFIIISKINDPVSRLLLGWLLIAPIASSPTVDLPHAVRTLVFLPLFQIMTAVGIIKIILKLSKFLLIIFYFLLTLVIIFNTGYYFNQYYIHQNAEYSEYWQYGYKQAVELTEKIKNKYKKIVVSTKLEQSYMFFLFFTKYEPVKYLSAGGTKSGGINSFGKYEFRPIDWSKERHDGTILYVGSPSDISNANIANINFLNGKPAITVAE